MYFFRRLFVLCPVLKMSNYGKQCRGEVGKQQLLDAVIIHICWSLYPFFFRGRVPQINGLPAMNEYNSSSSYKQGRYITNIIPTSRTDGRDKIISQGSFAYNRRIWKDTCLVCKVVRLPQDSPQSHNKQTNILRKIYNGLKFVVGCV